MQFSIYLRYTDTAKVLVLIESILVSSDLPSMEGVGKDIVQGSAHLPRVGRLGPLSPWITIPYPSEHNSIKLPPCCEGSCLVGRWGAGRLREIEEAI